MPFASKADRSLSARSRSAASRSSKFQKTRRPRRRRGVRQQWVFWPGVLARGWGQPVATLAVEFENALDNLTPDDVDDMLEGIRAEIARREAPPQLGPPARSASTSSADRNIRSSFAGCGCLDL